LLTAGFFVAFLSGMVIPLGVEEEGGAGSFSTLRRI